jgi:tRNA-uridine 2-sulfurtransferase
MAKVMVALSGGVDSAVAALLLRRQGHDILGVTVKTTVSSELEALWEQTLSRAVAVCSSLGIPHQTAGFTAEFSSHVVGYFVNEYACGRTPNPCVICNPIIKWGFLLQHALAEGCEYVATGHYARTRYHQGRHQLLRGVDAEKDQSYMLYRLSQRQLAHTLFPLGDLDKQQVRQTAAESGLPVADTEESQDLCFVAADRLADFVGERLNLTPGPIVDTEGQTLGEHRGLAHYTVGQRRGLGIAAPEPLFVLRKDPEHNTLVVGPHEALQCRCCYLSRLIWVSIPAPANGERISGQLEVRYRTRPVSATLEVHGERAVMELDSPQVCAPGQSGVLYDGNVLLGGGIIEAG